MKSKYLLKENDFFPSAGEVNKSPAHLYIPSLDGFRMVAILLVFLSHAGLGAFVPGGLGVTIFFFLSGYLITTLLRVEYERKQSFDLRKFYLRRIVRIWPAFYFVLIVGILLTLLGVLPGYIDGKAVAAQFLHVINYFGIYFDVRGVTAGSGVLWSLAIEEHFYLAFPLLYAYFLNKGISSRKLFAVFVSICLAVLVWRCYLIGVLQASSDRTYYATDTRIDGLLFGCSLAVFGNPVFDGAPKYERLLKYVLVPVALGVMAFCLVYRSEFFRETFRYTLQGLALMPIFIAAVSYPEWFLFKPLNSGVAKFFGKISYSFYLVHYTVIEGLNAAFPALPKFVAGLLAMAVATLIAYLMGRWIERPMLKYRRLLAS